MKPIKSLIVLAIVIAPALASAQGYYGNGGPGGGYRVAGGFHNRMNRLIYGGSLGVGGMTDNGNDIECDNCDYSPLALEGDVHIGGFVGPRFALMAEAQINLQTVHNGTFDENGDTTLTQGALMIAGQFWLTPIIWVKGGVGVAHLSLDNDYYTNDIDNGFAVMGGAGIELLSARFFSIDLQGRIIEGTFRGVDDHVTSGTVGIGLNWY